MFQFDFENSFIVKIISFLSSLIPDGPNDLYETMHEELPDILLPNMGDTSLSEEDLKYLAIEATDNTERFKKIVNMIIIIVSIIVFIVFLFLPLFSKKFRNFIKENKLFKILKSFINNIKEFFVNLFSGQKNKSGFRIEREKKLYSDFIKKTEKTEMSKEKKKEIGEFAKIFFKLVSIGEEKNIGLTDSMTPMEYISLMIKSFESQKNELYKIGFLFEKHCIQKIV